MIFLALYKICSFFLSFKLTKDKKNWISFFVMKM